MIPTPIRQVLSTLRTNGVQALLMGGQACVFYGAAQVSKDVDLVLLADDANYERLRDAVRDLGARRIALPPFDTAALERGHAVHFRCSAPGVEDLRVDVMTCQRDLSPFAVLWERRTSFTDDTGMIFDLLSIPDLVQAKKTQRSRDCPVIELLVDIHYRENSAAPSERPSVLTESRLYKMFDAAGRTTFFSQTPGRQILKKLTDKYGELSADVHTASASQMSRITALSHFPSFDRAAAKSASDHTASISTQAIVALCVCYNDAFHRMHRRNKETIVART